MEQSDQLWSRYAEALMVAKFSLHSVDNSQSIQVLSDLFSNFQRLKIRRRVIELHAYIRYSLRDSNLLTVLRFIDSMYKRSRKMSNTLDATNIKSYFCDKNRASLLSSLVIGSLYWSVYDACQQTKDDFTESCSTLEKMSTYYHTLVS